MQTPVQTEIPFVEVRLRFRLLRSIAQPTRLLKTPHAAAAKLSAIHTRQKRGGGGWKPRAFLSCVRRCAFCDNPSVVRRHCLFVVHPDHEGDREVNNTSGGGEMRIRVPTDIFI